jgi:hypothetical protein
MEFAYPGVGILAGDSIQYLCIATAHGVIMVFFMVMPAIFGPFGNFLLPTQLGVHDVAFPRLNSAAFWFLPGGLIMLCQLVCVDRRYQRMNCFNIREIQGILKRKFFTDLVNTSDNRSGMDSTLVGMRHKHNMSNILLYDQSLFYNFDLTNTSKYKNFSILSSDTYTYSTVLQSIKSKLPTTLLNITLPNLHLPTNPINQIIKDFLYFIYPAFATSFLSIYSSTYYFKNVLVSSLYLPTNFTLNNLNTFYIPSSDNASVVNSGDINYTSSSIGYSNYNSLLKSSLSDNSSS